MQLRLPKIKRPSIGFNEVQTILMPSISEGTPLAIACCGHSQTRCKRNENGIEYLIISCPAETLIFQNVLESDIEILPDCHLHSSRWELNCELEVPYALGGELHSHSFLHLLLVENLGQSGRNCSASLNCSVKI
jgi:hypothetical protein